MDVLSLCNPPGIIAARTAAIYQTVLKESPRVKQPNFDRIGSDDLARLVDLYDRHFFEGWLAGAVKAKTGAPLMLRLSAKMTRVGGKTSKYRTRRPGGGKGSFFEIAIASRMLFQTFRDVQRPVVVCGLTCADRLEALQRIMEHEIVHLIELLVWDQSSCSGQRFKRLTANIFGHTDRTHALVTAREYAAVRHGVVVGGMVSFEFDGRRLTGRVNRIHHRATVLVEDDAGRPYSNGKRYARYYVPLGSLRAVIPQAVATPQPAAAKPTTAEP